MINSIILNYINQEINIEYFYTNNCKNTILFLHGLGANKDDFLETSNNEIFKDFNLIGIDFPGTNRSTYLKNITIDNLVEILNLFLEKLDLEKVILVGHSMGGVVGLKFADKFPSKVISFVNIEGNLIKKDASFSGYISQLSYEKFKEEFGDNKSLYDLSLSLVEESENGDFLTKFINLFIPKIYIYGDKSEIPTLNVLKDNGINTRCIPDSGHHPFIDNPDEFNKTLLEFITNN
ncbi:MAG: alpha/beta hydrolase [Candidatus Gracilibacteria bacterium]|nr:alpha/beta hydrolase [Candidatus Gracilibacteria bacterium]